MTNTSTDTLFYIMDPLCGWCFGFSPVMKQLEKEYSGQLRFEVFVGGLVLGNRVASINDGFSFIKDATPRLENMTGVKMGAPFMALVNDGKYIMNSEPSCKALAVVKSMEPSKALSYAHALQNALFINGLDLNQVSTFVDLCKAQKIDEKLFLAQYNATESTTLMQQHFATARAAGADGFPALVLKHNDKWYALAKGYRPYAELKKDLDKLLKD